MVQAYKQRRIPYPHSISASKIFVEGPHHHEAGETEKNTGTGDRGMLLCAVNG